MRLVAIYNDENKFTGATGVFHDITELKITEQALRERELELETKTKNLEEMNTALSVLLKKREADKEELEERIISNIKRIIEPFLAKLKKCVCQNETHKTYIDIIESQLNDITSQFALKLTSKILNLSPSEVKVATLIKHGARSKEIANIMNLSINTVDSYRYRIRCKLGIKNKAVNLTSHLATFQ